MPRLHQAPHVLLIADFESAHLDDVAIHYERLNQGYSSIVSADDIKFWSLIVTEYLHSANQTCIRWIPRVALCYELTVLVALL